MFHYCVLWELSQLIIRHPARPSVDLSPHSLLQSVAFAFSIFRSRPMSRTTPISALAGLALLLPVSGAQTAPPATHNEVLIKNAIVMTVTHGRIEGGSIYIK